VEWGNGETDSMIDKLGAGSYHVEIKDNNGCLVIEEIILEAPAEIVISATLEFPTNNEFNGSITLSVFGGTEPYSIYWNNDTEMGMLFDDNLAPGIYHIKVIDQNGCEKEIEITLSSVSTLNINDDSTKGHFYPNPASKSLYLTKTAHILIKSLSGSTLFDQEVDADKPINLENYQPGIYLISINGAYKQKLVIKH
jgi:hypothetical protein